MNLGIRAILYSARKWKKTLLVFFLLLAITTLVLSGLAVADAQEEQNRISMEGLLAVGGIFLVCNIPTVVLGGIWLHYKNRRDFQNELNKMNIQDLG